MARYSNNLIIHRYLLGLKTASLFYGIASISALALNFLYPFSEIDSAVMAFQLTLLIASLSHFGICFFSNHSNYKFLLFALISRCLSRAP
jgi:hypothetical protein